MRKFLRRATILSMKREGATYRKTELAFRILLSAALLTAGISGMAGKHVSVTTYDPLTAACLIGQLGLWGARTSAQNGEIIERLDRIENAAKC
jgi:hypothetical protein